MGIKNPKAKRNLAGESSASMAHCPGLLHFKSLIDHLLASVRQCSPAVLEEDADAQVAHQRRRLQAAARPHGATVTGLRRHESWRRQGEEGRRRRKGAESSRMGRMGLGLFGVSIELHGSGSLFVVKLMSRFS